MVGLLCFGHDEQPVVSRGILSRALCINTRPTLLQLRIRCNWPSEAPPAPHRPSCVFVRNAELAGVFGCQLPAGVTCNRSPRRSYLLNRTRLGSFAGADHVGKCWPGTRRACHQHLVRAHYLLHRHSTVLAAYPSSYLRAVRGRYMNHTSVTRRIAVTSLLFAIGVAGVAASPLLPLPPLQGFIVRYRSCTSQMFVHLSHVRFRCVSRPS